MEDENIFMITLKEKLKAMNLAVTGNNAELIARLNQADPESGQKNINLNNDDTRSDEGKEEDASRVVENT